MRTGEQKLFSGINHHEKERALLYYKAISVGCPFCHFLGCGVEFPPVEGDPSSFSGSRRRPFPAGLRAPPHTQPPTLTTTNTFPGRAENLTNSGQYWLWPVRTSYIQDKNTGSKFETFGAWVANTDPGIQDRSELLNLASEVYSGCSTTQPVELDHCCITWMPVDA